MSLTLSKHLFAVYRTYHSSQNSPCHATTFSLKLAKSKVHISCLQVIIYLAERNFMNIRLALSCPLKLLQQSQCVGCTHPLFESAQKRILLFAAAKRDRAHLFIYFAAHTRRKDVAPLKERTRAQFISAANNESDCVCVLVVKCERESHISFPFCMHDVPLCPHSGT
jgi:hypothetical protein